jgi:hypothetical protein
MAKATLLSCAVSVVLVVGVAALDLAERRRHPWPHWMGLVLQLSGDTLIAATAAAGILGVQLGARHWPS